MRIGIMGAMMEEIALLREEMTDVIEEQVGGRTYFYGSLYGIDTVLVFSRWGKVAAATTATTLITKYDINCLIFTGVAGGAANELNIGDVIVSSQLYQHDMDARPLFMKYQIPLTNTIFFNANSKLINYAQQATQKFFANEFKQLFDKNTLEYFSMVNPKAYMGKIASGDMFISDNAKLDAISADMPDLLAVEMEGAAVAQVCTEYDIPFAVIRVISDKADQGAAIDFQKFVQEIAKYYSQGIIKYIYESIHSKIESASLYKVLDINRHLLTSEEI